MKIHAINFSVLLLNLFLTQSMVAEDVKYEQSVDLRIGSAIDAALAEPWPDWPLTAATALAVSEGESPQLNLAVLDAHRAYTWDEDQAPSAYHDPRPDRNIFRLYLVPRLQAMLSAEAKDAIEDMCWRWIYRHSILSSDDSWPFNNPTKSPWIITGSENHDAIQRAANLLSLQVLIQAGAPYGPDTKLYDGNSVAQHLAAWEVWYVEYFRQRAREGLDCEIAHPVSYGLGTIGAYNSIFDLAANPQVRTAVRKFLDLYWAEVATEFEPRTGLRASISSTRCYKFSWNQQASYWASPLLYAYGWSDIPSFPNLTMMRFFLSDYRPPQILQAIAHDAERGNYQSTSRRFGLGADNWNRGLYTVLFEDGVQHNSYIRRDTWYTPAYALSSISLDLGKTYVELVNQSRVVGVTFSASLEDRLVAYGGNRPTDKAIEYKMTTGTAINSVLGQDSMVVARHPKADSRSSTMRIFVSNGNLWGNRQETETWFFTRSGDGYAAFRIAGNDGYTVTPAPYGHGYFVEGKDIWAPVAIQTAQAGDFQGDFEAFKAAVVALPFSYSNDQLSFQSLSGDTFEYWSNSTNLPMLNGVTVDLNPARTYDSPFLDMIHGTDVAVVSYPGFVDYVLDFSND